MSEYLNMSLHDWEWFGEDIITCTKQINVENFMVLDYTEYSLIVVQSSCWDECDLDSNPSFGWDSSLNLGELEHVFRISNELELGWEWTLIDNIYQSWSGGSQRHFTKVDALWTEMNIES